MSGITEVHPTGFHAERAAQQLDLADEVAVTVDHALGHAGGAAGEQDRRHVLAVGAGQHRPTIGACALECGQGRSTPAKAATDSDQAGGRRRPAQRQPRHMRQRDTDEGLRLRLVQALLQRAPVDARVDQHRHRAQLEQRKHQQEEFRRRPHHHHRAHAAADAVAGQAGRHGIAAGVQLAIVQGHVIGRHAIAGTAAAGAADGDLVRAVRSSVHCRRLRNFLRGGPLRGKSAPSFLIPTAARGGLPMQHPCMTCGACCTQYRVACHWMESDEVTPGGVPHQLTEVLDPHRLCMRGTHSKPVRCVALDAQIGVYSRCTIHPNRPSVCREVDASWEYGKASPQCDKARIAYGLDPLTLADWRWRDEAGNDDGHPDDNGNSPSSPPQAPVAA
ncbi:hypothetical protein G6F68_010632 [Rhizopus microsporus]|nr:hypothetical protein G6F68_010632 [Rhizopus microsporus]